jgi:hypothetical protein
LFRPLTSRPIIGSQRVRIVAWRRVKGGRVGGRGGKRGECATMKRPRRRRTPLLFLFDWLRPVVFVSSLAVATSALFVPLLLWRPLRFFSFHF